MDMIEETKVSLQNLIFKEDAREDTKLGTKLIATQPKLEDVDFEEKARQDTDLVTELIVTQPEHEDVVLEEEGREDTELIVTQPRLDDVEELILYTFKNKGLLEQALTDKTYKVGCPTYERLEYLGDAVLGVLIAKYHYDLYPDKGPGQLTPLRSANVDTEKLARAALKLNLHKYFRHNKPEFNKKVQEFINDLPKYPIHSYGQVYPPKYLADIVEAIIGAVYDDSKSFDTTWEVAKVILEPIISPEMLEMQPGSKLNEFCQAKGLELKPNDLWNVNRSYEYYIDKQLIGRGVYEHKKEIAINRAAEDAYKFLIKSLSNGNISNGQ